MAASDPNKDQLLGVLQDTEAASRALQAGAQEIVGKAKYTADVAASLREVLQASSTGELGDIEAVARLTDAWSAQRDQTKATSEQLAATPLWASTTASAFFTTTQSVLSFRPSFLETNKAVTDKFWTVVHRPERFKETRAAMVLFGLDASPPGIRNPVSLLEDANNAMTRPSGADASPTGVLVVLRAAIEGTIAALLQRRPTQEGAKREQKILSLGRQCGLTGIQSIAIDRLAEQYVVLVDHLSDAKQAAMPPGTVRHHFDEGLQFLTTLLASLDVTKLKPPLVRPSNQRL